MSANHFFRFLLSGRKIILVFISLLGSIPGSKPGRRWRRMARQRRCLEAALVQEDRPEALQSVAHQESGISHRKSASPLSSPPPSPVTRPALSLRSVFPETWLFSLDFLEESKLARCLTIGSWIVAWFS